MNNTQDQGIRRRFHASLYQEDKEYPETGGGGGQNEGGGGRLYLSVGGTLRRKPGFGRHRDDHQRTATMPERCVARPQIIRATGGGRGKVTLDLS